MASKDDDDAVATAAIESRGNIYDTAAVQELRQMGSITYRPEYIDQARKLAAAGWTNEEMAEFFDVALTTFLRWKNTNAAFAEAVRMGKEIPDDRVEGSLYRMAIGYQQRVEKLFHHQGSITRADVVEQVAPNVKAAGLWLMNRRPDKWRNKPEMPSITQPAGTDNPDRPRLSRTELARRTVYMLTRSLDEEMSQKMLASAGPGQSVMAVVEEKITHTTEE